jgi:hypothetical protein
MNSAALNHLYEEPAMIDPVDIERSRIQGDLKQQWMDGIYEFDSAYELTDVLLKDPLFQEAVKLQGAARIGAELLRVQNDFIEKLTEKKLYEAERDTPFSNDPND